MRKLWNPFEAYRRASQKNKAEQTRHDATTRICIRDYTDSNGNTYTALMVDSIPVHHITADNISESELLLTAIRNEYYNKRMEAVV